MAETYALQKKTGSQAQTAEPPPPAPPPPAPPNAVSRKKPAKRLVSLDACRGFIMMMLAASGFGIARMASLGKDNDVWKTWDYETFQRLKFHFTHPPWESITGMMGVSFWDMIQPCFMFMVGVAMPFSYARREAMGSGTTKRTLHALFRAVVLTLMGVFLYSLSQPQTNWIFTNVLAQIGLGYFFAYLLLGRGPHVQLGAIFVILVGYWGLFILNPPAEDFDYAAGRYSAESDESMWGMFITDPLPANYEIPTVENGQVYEGRFAPWSKNSNIAHQFDVWLLNKLRMPNGGGRNSESGDSDAPPPEAGVGAMVKSAVASVRGWWFSSPSRHVVNRGGYVTLNFIPSIATTLLGMLCGQLLLSEQTSRRKLLLLVAWGAISLTLGILAHHTVCPIVKRIWTPSWVLFSGGYAMWLLALFYLLFDILPFRKLAFPLIVIGMNSIVIYMMGQMLRPWVTSKIVQTHFGLFLKSCFGPQALSLQGQGTIILPTAAFMVFWLIAFWMHRNRYFVRV